jgi:hypothetical protein
MSHTCRPRPTETMKMTRRDGRETVPSYGLTARASGPSYFFYGSVEVER